jgi:hypothetical protein
VRNDTSTTPANITVRYDTATTCGYCGTTFVAVGRQRWCSDACRQGAWRTRQAAPRPPQPAKADTVYACPFCDGRYLGEQRCPECNCWCTRVGPGGPCPHCDGLVALADIVEEAALARSARRAPARRSR